ncbi:hypothetical protein JVT61DRAFT_12248 [Boletus reticuloceps]|uniref:Uncharacterized protein n=1 Tax=Boletus reticuloceps TaxID=495285 RepID=A0A8I2YEB7_9AGAM|nr:hypothetical protein JVT61DRAFT_12248 [Boletus reticuloceps]
MSWKESWGHEPPGWQSRSTHPPIEVPVISPAPDIRDVFSGGRQTMSMGDESDWADEDEGIPEFAGGIGPDAWEWDDEFKCELLVSYARVPDSIGNVATSEESQRCWQVFACSWTRRDIAWSA